MLCIRVMPERLRHETGWVSLCVWGIAIVIVIVCVCVRLCVCEWVGREWVYEYERAAEKPRDDGSPACVVNPRGASSTVITGKT